jgi:hypothetical protein
LGRERDNCTEEAEEEIPISGYSEIGGGGGDTGKHGGGEVGGGGFLTLAGTETGTLTFGLPTFILDATDEELEAVKEAV